MSYTPFKMKGFSGFGNSPMKQEKSYGVLKSDKNKSESYGVLRSDKNKSESDEKMTKTVEPIERKGFTKTVGKIARKAEQVDKTKAKLVESKRKLTDREIRISKAKEFNAYAEKQGLKPPQPKTDEEVASYTEFYKNKDNVNMLKKEQAKYFKNKKK